MRNFLAAITFVAFAVPAFAADMPVKGVAVPRAPLFYGGSGFYYGMEMGATQTKLGGSVNGVNIYSAGGTMSATAGWTRAIGTDRWVAFEASGNWSNADGSAVDANGVAISVKRKYSMDLTAMYGAPASVLAGIFSNADIAFGALPPSPCGGTLNCIASNVHPFVLAGIHYGRTTTDVNLAGIAGLEENRNKLRFQAGVGALVQVTSATVWRTTAAWTFGSQDKGAGFLFIPGAPINEGGTVAIKSGVFYAF